MTAKATPARATRARVTPCTHCPLRQLKSYREFTPEELRFVEAFKVGEARFRAGETILAENEPSPYLYTVLDGWAVKHKSLEDGRRQIINYALPGDLLGLQSAMLERMRHAVDALTDVTLCVFPKERLWSLFEKHPGLAFDITWIAAEEKSILADFLVSVGQRSAAERIAFLLLTLFRRAARVGLADESRAVLPLTQEHLADTIGFSLVHTNKSLTLLRRAGVFSWSGFEFTLHDEATLYEMAGHPPGQPVPRPFI